MSNLAAVKLSVIPVDVNRQPLPGFAVLGFNIAMSHASPDRVRPYTMPSQIGYTARPCAEERAAHHESQCYLDIPCIDSASAAPVFLAISRKCRNRMLVNAELHHVSPANIRSQNRLVPPQFPGLLFWSVPWC